ncbi:MAG: hypothetical protein KGD58_13795 [Candidatus Lokiarchaeota archaeon]|nr:hypothetical protein [Candidatus Lokiarchaeota archaeon]
MPKNKKTGWYEHLTVLIFAQGVWNEKDRAMVRTSLQNKRNKPTDNPYPFYLKLTHRKNPPEFADCELCHHLYQLFKEIWGSNDGSFYQGHHYLDFENDVKDMKDMAKLILSFEKVKKFYLLYVKGFSEIKTTVIKAMSLTELKEKLINKRCSLEEFIQILNRNEFKNRTIYEVTRY